MLYMYMHFQTCKLSMGIVCIVLMQARILLVRLYLSIGDVEKSEEHCLKLLQTDETASDSAALVCVWCVQTVILLPAARSCSECVSQYSA